jgi:hypothetical protein
LAQEGAGYGRGIGGRQVPVARNLGVAAFATGPAPDPARNAAVSETCHATLEDQQIGSASRPAYLLQWNRSKIYHGAPAIALEADIPPHRQLRHLTERFIQEPAVPICRPGEEHYAGSPGNGDEVKTSVGARFGVLVSHKLDSKHVVAGG